MLSCFSDFSTQCHRLDLFSYARHDFGTDFHVLSFYDIDRIFHARSRYEFATHRSAVVLLFGVLEYKKRDVANWSEK